MTEDRDTGRITVEVRDHEGDAVISAREFRHSAEGQEIYTILPPDPLSASGKVTWVHQMSREGWSIRTETETLLTGDKENFHIEARLRAWAGEELVRDLDWSVAIPRVMT